MFFLGFGVFIGFESRKNSGYGVVFFLFVGNGFKGGYLRLS